MCLNVQIGGFFTSKKEIELKDITPNPDCDRGPIICYKEGIVRDGTFRPDGRTDFEYKRGVEMPLVDFTFTPDYVYCRDLYTNEHQKLFRGVEVNRGYHSLIKNEKSAGYRPNHVFIIPFATEFYIGGINEYGVFNGYVSRTLIWMGHKRNPLTWLRVFNYRRKHFNKF